MRSWGSRTARQRQSRIAEVWGRQHSTDMRSITIVPSGISSSQNRPSDNRQYGSSGIGYTAHPFPDSSLAGARSARYLATRLHVSGMALSQVLPNIGSHVDLLVTLRLRISSSLTALSINFRLVSSTTKTFHCKENPVSCRHRRGEAAIPHRLPHNELTSG